MEEFRGQSPRIGICLKHAEPVTVNPRFLDALRKVLTTMAGIDSLNEACQGPSKDLITANPNA